MKFRIQLVVGALARRGALLSQDFVIFHSPPSDVAFLVGLDAVGTMYVWSQAIVSDVVSAVS